MMGLIYKILFFFSCQKSVYDRFIEVSSKRISKYNLDLMGEQIKLTQGDTEPTANFITRSFIIYTLQQVSLQ